MIEEPEDLTSAAPTDLTVELNTDVLDEIQSTVAPENYWRPRTRLSTRLEPSRRTPTTARSNRQWWIAGLIVVGAIIVAVALWLAALWAQGREDSPDSETDEAAASLVIEVPTAGR